MVATFFMEDRGDHEDDLRGITGGKLAATLLDVAAGLISSPRKRHVMRFTQTAPCRGGWPGRVYRPDTSLTYVRRHP
jgi:hypothetical protein